MNENELLQMKLDYARDTLNALTTRYDQIEILNATYVRDIINLKKQYIEVLRSIREVEIVMMNMMLMKRS